MESDLDPASERELEAFLNGREAPPQLIDAGAVVCAVGLPREQRHVVTSTLAYLFGDERGKVLVVDPGWNSDTGYRTILEALARLGAAAVDEVVLTHLHPDHIGMAERLRREYGASILMGETEWNGYLRRTVRGAADHDALLDRWHVPVHRRPRGLPRLAMPEQELAAPPDRLLRDGDATSAGAELEVIATPGHTAGSIVLVHRPRGVVLTGDTVLPHVYPAIGMDDAGTSDPFGDYLRSLERLAPFDGFTALPGHGYRFRRLDRRLAQTAMHHLRRSREVLSAVRERPESTVWEVASQLTWTHGWDKLEGRFLLSALRQAEMHMGFVAVEANVARWLDQPFE